VNIPSLAQTDSVAERPRSEPSPPEGDVVAITLPARLDRVRLLRLVAAGLGVDADLGVADVEDLRSGVDELSCLLFAAARPGSLARLRFTVADGVVAFRATVERRPGAPIEPDEVSRLVLDAVTDGYAIEASAEELQVELVRRRRSGAPQEPGE